jgi:hypothetical protein
MADKHTAPAQAQLPERVRLVDDPFGRNRRLLLVHTDTKACPQAHEACKSATTSAGRRMFAWANGLGCWVAYKADQEALNAAVRIARDASAERPPMQATVHGLDLAAALAQ